jgi:glycosyltransferase involved in cell wall biosynthesis
MTRVLHVISGLGSGGAECFLASLAPRLAAAGIEQHVVSLTGHGVAADRLHAAGIPVSLLDVRGVLKAPLAIRRLSRLIRSFEPDSIQGWMYHGDLFAALARKLAGDGRSRLHWGIRCSDMNLNDYSRQLRLAVKACAMLSSYPDTVVANSEAGVRVHAAGGYTPRAWRVIANGIDTNEFHADLAQRAAVRAELGLDPHQVVVVNVARVDPMKDHAILVAAMSRARGACALLIGLGTDALNTPPQILGLGRRRDIARLLTAGDIIVSSSAYGEGFSNAVAEGMAAGLVPVMTDVGDARNIVGDTGVIVPPHDAVLLGNAINSIAAMSPDHRRTRGEAARGRIMSEFNIERAVSRYCELYGGVESADKLCLTIGQDVSDLADLAQARLDGRYS